MALVVISYNVKSKHDAVMKKCLIKKGYEDNIVNDTNITCNLPNTTLKRYDVTPQIALDDMKKCATKVGAKLERAIALEVQSFSVIKGEPYSE